ncbi:MAG: hypothetical protein ACTSRU_04345 [Candidatus Hodarchaeales archaeon]
MNSKISTKLIFLWTVMLVIIFLTCSIAATAQILPVIEISEENEDFTPLSYNNRDYYVIPASKSYSNVKYTGPISAAQYTQSRTDYLRTYSTSISDGNYISSSLTTSDIRSSQHPLFSDESLPRAVSLESGIDNTTTSAPTTTTSSSTSFTSLDNVFTKVQEVPISLHQDYSFTFLARGQKTYFGLYKSSAPFYLDIHIKDCESSGSIRFGSANPSLFYITHKKNTFPVFPTEGTVLNFTLTLSETTLVTLTRHKMTLPAPLATMKVNESYTGEINQGCLLNQGDGCIGCPDNDIASLRILSMSKLLAGEYYKIYMYVVDHCLTCDDNDPSSYTLPIFLEGEYDIISGSLDKNGVLIKANVDEVLQLALYSVGVVQQEYTIYFRNILKSGEDIIEERQLVLNEDVELEKYVTYNFTLTNPVMMAINVSSEYWFSFFREGNDETNWIAVPSLFNVEYNRLYGDYHGDLGTNWKYIPAGRYAIRVSNKDEGAMIRFNTKVIMKTSMSSIQLSVNQDSLFAIEIPVMKNRINRVNLTTIDQTQSVNYEYSILGKYNEFFSETGGCTIGSSANNSLIYEDIITRTNEIPILLVRPYSASNDTFLTSLTVQMTTPGDYYPLINKDKIGYGNFIPMNPISTSTSFEINDDYTDGNHHIYGIPMSLPENNLYNITVALEGENSDISYVYAHGGNLRDIEVFNSYDIVSNGSNYHWIKFIMLSVTSNTYLYVSIQRSGNANCQVLIEKLPIINMNFTLPELEEYEWVSSRLDGEKKSTAKAANLTQIAGKTPGFEVSIAIATLVVISVIIRNKRRNNR